MDFRSPPEVIRALHEKVDHGIFGYTEVPERLASLIIDHLSSLNNWQIDRSWLVWLAAVVPGFNMAARTVGQPGDSIVLPVPAYHPLFDVHKNSNQIHAPVQLVRNGDKWEMDLDAIDETLVRTKSKLIMLCNPQNPTGRVYTKRELEGLAEVALKRGAVICSDEIHCDLLLEPALEHIPIASLGPEIANQCITLMAPTKTFNMPGLNFAFAVVQNPELRTRYRASRLGMQPSLSPLSLVAAEAAYLHGWPWLVDLRAYLKNNARALQATVNALPDVQMTPVEATCLGWIDVRSRGFDNPMKHFEQHGLGLSDGAVFGAEGFVRFNFGCPRQTLEEGLSRLRRALAEDEPKTL